MLDHQDPQKAKLAKLVGRALAYMKLPRDPEDIDDLIEVEGDSKAAFLELKAFVVEWGPESDLSYADLGEVVLEEVLCSCAQFHLDGTHHPDCDAWDSKAD